MQNSAYQTPGHDEIRFLLFSDLRMGKEGLLYERHKQRTIVAVRELLPS